MALAPSSTFAGVVVTGAGQTGEIICAFIDTSGAVTDATFTRNDTNATLAAKDGYRIRVISLQLCGGGSADHTITLNSKPNGTAGVAITPAMSATKGAVVSIDIGAVGLCTTRENEQLTATLSGDCGILIQAIYEPVYNIVQTIPVTNPALPGTPLADFDAAKLAYSDNGSTPVSNNGLVYRWDAAGGNYQASQATSAFRPTYKAAQFKGKPAIEFSTDEFLTLGGTANLWEAVDALNAEFTLFMVVRHLNATGNQTTFSFGATSANNILQFGTNTNTYIAHRTDSSGNVDNFTSSVSDPVVPALLTFVADNSGNGTLSFFRRLANESARASDTPTGTNITFNSAAVLSVTNATIGALRSGSPLATTNYANVQIARIVLYDSELSAEARSYMENQLIGLYL